MATFTVAIAEAISVWGGEPTSKWGVMDWGDNWAFGTDDLIVTVYLDRSDTVSLSDTWGLVTTFNRSFSETIDVSGAMSEQELFDSRGFNHVFTGGSVDGEDRSLTQFSEQAGPANSFSEVAPPTNTWSES